MNKINRWMPEILEDILEQMKELNSKIKEVPVAAHQLSDNMPKTSGKIEYRADEPKPRKPGKRVKAETL